MTAFLVTVTVGQDRPEGEVQARSSLRNLKAIPKFQRLCQRYGIRPSYFLTYPILSTGESVRFRKLQESDRCDTGICLQPWTTPPFEANENRLIPTPSLRIPSSSIQRKLNGLAGIYEDAFGVAPRIHRAEAGGLSGACVQSLETLNFLADSSALPGIDATALGGLDWRDTAQVPYHPCRQSPANRGHSPVLEIPISVGHGVAASPTATKVIRGLPRWMPISRLLANRIYPLGNPCQLEPSLSTISEMRLLADQHAQAHIPHLNLSLRSEYLQAGESAVSASDEDVTRIFDTLDSIFRYAVDTLRATPATVTEYAEHYLRPGTVS